MFVTVYIDEDHGRSDLYERMLHSNGDVERVFDPLVSGVLSELRKG